MANSDWIKRRWFDFRNGHSIYLIFVMAFFQFTIITYTLAIERFAVLEQIFPSMWIWTAFFVSVYVPAAVIIGHFHRKHQMPTEARQNTVANPYTFQAMPGKERLYNLRGNQIAYNIQLRSMEMHNSMADAISQLTGKPIPKWNKDDFEIIQEMRYITDRLEKGDNIFDIYDELTRREKLKNEAPQKDISLNNRES